jgi:hypothetical protein
MKTKTGKKRGWFMWLAIGLLVTHVAGMMTAVYIAVGDRTFIAMPDYYGKSIRWDQTQEIARRSEARGWTRFVSILPANEKGERVISIRVIDKYQKPVVGLKAEAVVFPELFPNLVQNLVMAENVDGTYTASYVKPAHGPLVIELTATRGTETYVTRSTLMVGGAR